MRLLGIIAIIWTIDCFVGFYLTLPARRRANAGRSATRARAARPRLLGALEARLEDQDVRQRVSHQLRHPPRLQPLDMAAAVRHRLHGIFAQSLSEVVLAADEEGVELYADALRAAQACAARTQPIEPKLSFADMHRARRRPMDKAAAGTDAGRRGLTMHSSSAFMASASSSRATITAPAASARRNSFTTAKTAARSARGSLGRHRGAISSCRPSSRCIRDASLAFPAAS